MDPQTLYIAGFGVGTTVALLVLLRVLQRVMTPGHTVARDLQADNGAWRLLQVGDVFAVFLLAAAVVKHGVTGEDLQADLVHAASYGAAGLVLVQLAGLLSTRALLRGQLRAELDRGNTAAGLAASAHYVATGILASRAVVGADLQDLGLALVFFVLAIGTHGIFVALFRALTTYDDAEQIRGENHAAAISYAGVSIAVAVLIARALEGEGDFPGWLTALQGFAGVSACALALYPIRQLVVQGLLLGARPSLRGGAIDQAIAVDRSEPLAALEATTYLAVALAIAVLA